MPDQNAKQMPGAQKRAAPPKMMPPGTTLPAPPPPQRADQPSRAAADRLIEQLMLANTKNARPMPQEPEGGLPPVPNIDEAWEASDQAAREHQQRQMKMEKKNYRPKREERPREMMGPQSWREAIRTLLSLGITDPGNMERQLLQEGALPPVQDTQHGVREDLVYRGPHGNDQVEPKMQRGPNRTFPQGQAARGRSEAFPTPQGRSTSEVLPMLPQDDRVRLMEMLMAGQGSRT